MSDFLKESQNQFDSIVIFSCLPNVAFKDFESKFKVIELNVFKEKFPTWFFRKTKQVAHLQHFHNYFFGINDNLNAVRTKNLNLRSIVTQFILKMTKFFNSEKWIQRYNVLQQISSSNLYITKNYSEQLKKENINQLFFTHQRPSFISPLIYAAEKLKN